jgi:hypothetical protein
MFSRKRRGRKKIKLENKDGEFGGKNGMNIAMVHTHVDPAIAMR